MRPRLFYLLAPFLILGQKASQPDFFPIPQNMQFTFPGAKLSPADTRLLEKALAVDIVKQDECEKKAPLREFPTANIAIGKLGTGILVRGSDACCGTGGCQMLIYVRERDKYRAVAESFGWAFAVVDSKTDVPDLAFASNSGGGWLALILQRYDGGRFRDHACEMLFSKGGFPKTPEDWFNPAVVEIHPCENSVPPSGEPRD